MPPAPTLPTEPIGSIPRPPALVRAIRDADAGRIGRAEVEVLYDEAVRDTLRRFEATGSPVCDGEQRKNHNFADYAVHGLPNFAPDGFKRRFVSHTRQWPRLTAGPFRYHQRGDHFLAFARQHTTLPLKQAVISPSALSLFSPALALPDYPREAFIADLLAEHESELAHEPDRPRVLQMIGRYIRPEQLGTTDDCGYCPFCDDTSTSRDTAFAKIAARVEGTALASAMLGR